MEGKSKKRREGIMERNITNSLGDETVFNLRRKGWSQASLGNKERKSFRAETISRCKDPNLGKNPTCLKNEMETSMSSAKQGGWVGGDGIKEVLQRTQRGPCSHAKELTISCYNSWLCMAVGSHEREFLRSVSIFKNCIFLKKKKMWQGCKEIGNFIIADGKVR